MALTAAAVQASIQAAAPDLLGPNWLKLTAAISMGVVNWARVPVNVVVTGSSTGVLGSGIVNGKLTVAPNPLPVNAAMAGAGLLGVQSANMARAVGVGVANAFTASAQYVGTSPTVGAGADTVIRVVAGPAKLTAAILLSAQGVGLQGVTMANLASALGTGIAAMISTGTTGIGTVVGAGGPAPSTGISISQVV